MKKHLQVIIHPLWIREYTVWQQTNLVVINFLSKGIPYSFLCKMFWGTAKLRWGVKLVPWYRLTKLPNLKKSNWCRLKMCVEETGETTHTFVFIIEEGEENLYAWIEERVRKSHLREKMKCSSGRSILLKTRRRFLLSQCLELI